MGLRSPCLLLGLLYHAQSAQGLRLLDPGPPAAGSGSNGSSAPQNRSGLRYPTLVIGGIDPTGSDAVLKALNSLGLGGCSLRDDFGEPSWGHTDGTHGRNVLIQHLLKGSERRMTGSKYRGDLFWFSYAVNWLGHVAALEKECMELGHVTKANTTALADLKWGFKEPHYAWFMPIMDEAYENRTNYLMVARDPRDTCNSKAMEQFYFYGAGDCYQWWASYWTEVLDAFEGEARLRVLRIEDLVEPEPLYGEELVHCMLDHAGLTADSAPIDAALEELASSAATSLAASLQSGNATLQLNTDADGVADRSELHPVMRRLGYNPAHRGLTEPQSTRVCRR